MPLPHEGCFYFWAFHVWGSNSPLAYTDTYYKGYSALYRDGL